MCKSTKENAMSKSEMRVIFVSAKLEVCVGFRKVDGYTMDYYVLRQAGKRVVQFTKETALHDVMRYADEVEFGSSAHIYEAATSL
jgi:hypothetical protein